MIPKAAWIGTLALALLAVGFILAPSMLGIGLVVAGILAFDVAQCFRYSGPTAGPRPLFLGPPAHVEGLGQYLLLTLWLVILSGCTAITLLEHGAP